MLLPPPRVLDRTSINPGDAVLCAASPDAVGLPDLDLETVTGLVKDLPFESTVRVLAYLAAEVHHHGRDRERHLRLARPLFDDQLYVAFARFVRASPAHLGFDPRHIASLQRLVVLHAGPDPASGRGLTPMELRNVGLALLGVASALPADAPGDHEPRTREDYDKWALYTARLAAWYHELELSEAMARAHSWFVDVHRSDELADHRGRCDIDAWLLDVYGLTLPELLAGGLACASMTHAFDADATAGQRGMLIGPGFFQNGPLAEKEEAFVQLISGSRSELIDVMREASNEPSRIAWDRSPFELRPFLRRADGKLALISARALAAWMTEGVYHRALSAARAQTHPRKPNETMGGGLLSYLGTVAETGARRLIAGSLREQAQAEIVRLHGEQRYRVRKGHCPLSPDVALSYAKDLVLIEVFSGRISRDTRSLLEPKLMRSWLDRATTTKLIELAERTRDLLTGHLTYDQVDAATVRIWPVLLLVGDPVMQTPALWRYLRDQAPDAFVEHERVEPATIATLNDFEPLLALVQEEGYTLPALLDEYKASSFSQAPPRNWVHARFGRIRRRPIYTEEQAEAAFRLGALQLFPGSRKLAEFRLHDEEAA